MNKRITITYFEPFGLRTTNVSMEVANNLKYNKVMLPVSFDNVEDTIKTLIYENDILVMLGEAGKYDKIKIELTPHNIKDGKDNYNIEYHNEEIKDYGPMELHTNINFDKLDYNYSYNAGKYLCNYSYYLALYHTTKCRVCFIHLPYVNELYTIDYMTKEINKIIDYIINSY